MFWMLLTNAAFAADTFTWDPVADTSLAVGLPVFFGVMYTHAEESIPPGSLETGELGPLDARMTPHYTARWDTLSDVFLYGSMVGGAAAAGLDGWLSEEPVAQRVGLMSQVIFTDLIVTDVMKAAFARPRPYTRDPAQSERSHHPDAARSFPSGHASATAAASFGAARVAHMSGNARPEVVYPVAGALTLAAGSLRVAAGVHYPSDVLAGAAAGTTIGLVIPSLHAAEPTPGAAATEDTAARVFSLSGRW